MFIGACIFCMACKTQDIVKRCRSTTAGVTQTVNQLESYCGVYQSDAVFKQSTSVLTFHKEHVLIVLK